MKARAQRDNDGAVMGSQSFKVRPNWSTILKYTRTKSNGLGKKIMITIHHKMTKFSQKL